MTTGNASPLTPAEELAVEASVTSGLTAAELPALVDLAKKVWGAASAEEEQLRVQLAGCLVAAEGGTSEAVVAKEGSYGWSLAYRKVLELRQRYEQGEKDLADVVSRLRAAGAELAELRGQPFPVHVTVERVEVKTSDPDAFAADLVDWARKSAPAAALSVIADPRVLPGHFMTATPGQEALLKVARQLAATLLRSSGRRATAILLGVREWRGFDCVEGMIVDGMAVKLVSTAESMIGVSSET